MSMDQPVDDGVEEAECGSTSWRIMTGRAKKVHHNKPEAASPPNPSDYVTPHPQSGPINIPTVPRPMKGRVTRSAGGTATVSGVYSLSPDTAGKMKIVVPAPPFGLHSADADTRSGTSDGTSHAPSTSKLRWQGNGSRIGTTVKGRVARAVESASAMARNSNSTSCTLDDGDTGSAYTGMKEEIQMLDLAPSHLTATVNTDTKSTLLKRLDSLEDELLEQEAAANVVDVCCDGKDLAATPSSAQSANSDPIGGHDSLELFTKKGMELVANGSEKSAEKSKC